MSSHVAYVTVAYGVSVLVIAGLATWIIADQRARKRELAALDAAGIRRRSEAREGGS